MAGEKENKMEKYIKLNTLANNQVVISTPDDRRFYSYDTLICVVDYDKMQFVLSDNESHFTKTTVKWLNRFLQGYDTTYQGIKKTAKRANLN